jgi:hypothetical protein
VRLTVFVLIGLAACGGADGKASSRTGEMAVPRRSIGFREHIRLANYSYKGDPSARERLGFIIEDDPASPAVDEGKTQVDLYGYTSMLVAAMKIQSRKLEQQSAELTSLRRKIDTLERQRKPARKSNAAPRPVERGGPNQNQQEPKL